MNLYHPSPPPDCRVIEVSDLKCSFHNENSCSCWSGCFFSKPELCHEFDKLCSRRSRSTVPHYSLADFTQIQFDYLQVYCLMYINWNFRKTQLKMLTQKAVKTGKVQSLTTFSSISYYFSLTPPPHDTVKMLVSINV